MNRAGVKYIIACFILVFSLLLGTGCQLLPDIDLSPPTTSPPPNTTPVNPDWTLPPVENNAPPLPSIANVVAMVKPSVVAINTEVVTYDIFNRPQTQEGAGSGWIIDKDGIIVTNNHVVEGAESVTITLTDGRTFPAETIRTDPVSDLAVVKINGQDLPAAKIGDSSQLKVGDWLVAIGNPLGLGISAKEGIVSRLDVSIPVGGQVLYNLIETSAAINPGNSGGPLVNMAGEVIGITSVKIATVEVEGIGYAISTETAIPIIEELVHKGYVIRPWLGVVLRTVDQSLVFNYNLAVDKGVFIVEVVPNSPAEEAGLEPEDVIVGFDDHEIDDVNDLVQAIHSSQIGQRVKITFWRGNTKHTADVVLAETPTD